jgi:hypothetical protein
MADREAQKVRHERLIRQYAQRAIAVAADACAAAIALKFAPPSRKMNQRMYRQQLERRFRAAVDDVSSGWAPDETSRRDSG